MVLTALLRLIFLSISIMPGDESRERWARTLDEETV